ncbi:alpha/beta fold hydrolase [Novosphingobium rosa]|uniref:alpha/beta fold hydrolase n=1 Tax=Novosphingobium rosa TaxID=76978 RepID=UPI0008317040|nr:alpha/beta fold hydrolase [Novosphingobium rosa]
MPRAFLDQTLRGLMLAAGLALAAGSAAAQDAGARQGFMVNDRVSLRYALAGPVSGPPVVLLHEMGMTLEGWDDVAPDLARDHRVLRYDLRGFGLSERIDGAVGIEDEVEDLRDLLDASGLRGPVVLVGGAVGGAIALRFAARWPERVRGVMALSPAVGVPPEARAATLAQAARIERTGMRALLGDMRDIYPDAIRHDAARLDRFRALQLSADPVSLAATLRMIATTDFAPIVAAVRCPVLVAGAALYPARPLAQGEALARHMAQGRFIALETGHFMAIQSPELLLPALRGFLAQVER